VEPTSDRIVHALLRHVAEAVGLPFAHRAEPEEASVAQPELHAGRLTRKDRRQAAPCHLAAVDWQSGADREPAHGRGNTVGADDEVVRAGGAVAESDGNALAPLAQRRDGGRKTAVHGGAGWQRVLQLGPVDANERTDIAPQRP